MNSRIERSLESFGTRSLKSGEAMEAITPDVTRTLEYESTRASVSGPDRASLVHIWNEKWSDTPLLVGTPGTASR